MKTVLGVLIWQLAYMKLAADYRSVLRTNLSHPILGLRPQKHHLQAAVTSESKCRNVFPELWISVDTINEVHLDLDCIFAENIYVTTVAGDSCSP